MPSVQVKSITGEITARSTLRACADWVVGRNPQQMEAASMARHTQLVA